MRLLMRYLGASTALNQVTTAQLDRFLAWLAHGRGVPCSAKSYARRVTALKVFFEWTKESKVQAGDPAATILQQRAESPLPQILYDGQIEEVLRVTREMIGAKKPDARPYLLISLVLATGIKKSECMAIKLSHIDLSTADEPVVFIRYDSARYRLKERKLRLPPDFPQILPRYLEQYRPKTNLFECTARNLEYVLDEIATRAGLAEGLSFEMLRWTSAVRDLKGGMDEEHLRPKMGLSPISWYETSAKLRVLAAPAL
jgi:integrase/recombinase XerD